MKEKQKLNNGKTVYAVILARSGSKKIKNKNILKLNKKPLISYPIKASIKSKSINKTFVLTDSIKYAKIAEKYGAIIPFIRPKKISNDNSRDIEAFKYFYNWLEENNKKKPYLIVHLRATAPMVDYKIIDKAVSYFLKNNADSMKSVEIAKDTPYKMWMLKNGLLKTVIKNPKNEEYWNYPRQKLPLIFKQNAQIDIFKTRLIKKHTISGKKIIPFMLDNFIDLDDKNDLVKLKKIFKVK